MLAKANIFTFFGNTALIGSGGGGVILWLQWLGEYSSGIGALSVIIGLIVGIVLKMKAQKEIIRHHNAEQLLGYSPKVSIRAGLRKFVAWHAAQADG